MAELPFVSNPYLEDDTVVEVPRPDATKSSKQSVPSPPPPPKRTKKQKRKMVCLLKGGRFEEDEAS